MTKIVNVKAIYPITGVPQIIRGTLNKVEMSTENIFKCLCGRAEVTEVIGDKLVPLNFDNYNKNNKPATEPAVLPTEPKKMAPSAPTVEQPATNTETPVTTSTENDTAADTSAEATDEDTSSANVESDEVSDNENSEETSDNDTTDETVDNTASNNNQVNNYNRKKHRR